MAQLPTSDAPTADRNSLIAAGRQFVIFLLGVAVILDALVAPGANIGELIVGLVLLGVVPLDNALMALADRWRTLRK